MRGNLCQIVYFAPFVWSRHATGKMGNGRHCMVRRNKGCERDHSSSWQFTSSISCEKLMLVVTRCYLCFKWVSYSTCITKQALENEPARPQKGELESLLSSKGVKSILCQLSFQYCLVKVVAPVLWPIRKEPFQSTMGRNGGLNPFRSVNCANFSTNRIQSQHQSRRYRLFSRASGNLILIPNSHWLSVSMPFWIRFDTQMKITELVDKVSFLMI